MFKQVQKHLHNEVMSYLKVILRHYVAKRIHAYCCYCCRSPNSVQLNQKLFQLLSKNTCGRKKNSHRHQTHVYSIRR